MVTFEIPVVPLTVTATALLGEDVSTAGNAAVGNPTIPGPTNRIIQRDQAWFVKFDWTTNGTGAAMLSGGTWRCEILLERHGGLESALNPTTSTSDLGVNGQSYSSKVNLAAFAVPAGVYTVVARMQYYYNNAQPSPFAGFENLGMVNIIDET